MLLVGLLAAFSVSAPWLTLTIILGLYIASLPFCATGLQKVGGEAAKLSPVDHNGEEKGNAGGD